MVLRTKEQNPVPALDSVEYKRLVGGKMSNMGMSAVGKMLKYHRRKKMMDGGVSSGGASSGGIAPAVMPRSRLSKHLM